MTLFGPIREAAGEKTLVRTLPDGATVGDLADDLADDYPALSGWLLNEDGEVDGGVNVTVNGTNVRQLDGAATTLGDGDVLRAAPPVVGGRE